MIEMALAILAVLVCLIYFCLCAVTERMTTIHKEVAALSTRLASVEVYCQVLHKLAETHYEQIQELQKEAKHD